MIVLGERSVTLPLPFLRTTVVLGLRVSTQCLLPQQSQVSHSAFVGAGSH